MFFTLSKVLFFLIQPINWLIGLLGWGILTKNPYKKARILRGAFWFIVVLTNPFLLNTTLRAWETPVVNMDSLRDTADIAIVLGGYTDFDVNADDRLNFNESSNRLLDAIILYKRGLVRKILITGGDGNLLGKQFIEATKSKPFLLDMGVKEADILLETASQNTYQNALFTKQLLDSQQVKYSKIVLLTSAFHMPRALGCFQKLGFEVQPFPAHFMAKRSNQKPKNIFIPDDKALYVWRVIFKEWIGCVVYRLNDYM